MRKRIFALLLAFCFALTVCPALGEDALLLLPTRDLGAVEVTVDERLQTLLDIMSYAIPEDCYGDSAVAVLKAGEAPDPALTEQALCVACAYARDTDTLSGEEAKELYAQLFTSGEMTLPEEKDRYYAVPAADGFQFRVEDFGQHLTGACLSSAEFDGTDVLVKLDSIGYSQTPFEQAPYLACQMELSLRYAPETEFGYTVNSIAVSPFYRCGDFSKWQEIENEAYHYTVNLPDELGQAGDDPQHMVWQNAQGDVTLTVDVTEESLSFDEALARFMQEHPGVKPVQQRQFDVLTAEWEGHYAVVVAAEGSPCAYTAVLTFPQERQAEYSLYGEIIRNSFGVRGLSNG